MDDPYELVVVHQGVDTGGMSDMLKAMLQAEGINCLVKSDTGVATAALGLSGGTFTLLVPREHAPRALELIRQVEASPDEEDLDEEEDDPRHMSLRERAHYNRTHRPAPGPLPVIGGLAVALFLLGLVDLWQGWGATWLLLGLSAFAFLVALRSRDS